MRTWRKERRRIEEGKEEEEGKSRECWGRHQNKKGPGRGGGEEVDSVEGIPSGDPSCTGERKTIHGVKLQRKRGPSHE